VREQAIGIDGPVPLSGTLALPEGDGPFPAVLIASGSGPLDRNSNHRRARFDVARQLAQALADAGLASLRYDKRGVGESPGDWRAAGFSDNADDLGAALHALAARPEIDPGRLLLAGHSEGALLAATLTARGSAVSGVVLLSMSATPGADLLLWQTRQIVPTLPGPVRRFLRLLRVDVEKKVAANHAKVRSTTTDVARIGGAKVNARWTREFMAHDPRADLARIDVPVLAITGDKDLQVPVDDLDVIASTVRGPVQVHRVPHLTHTLRTQPGAPSLSRYRRELREPVNREVLGAVTQWCSEVAGAAAAST
jgi:pimeloyl-ACP methyl ester carboxylesterase